MNKTIVLMALVLACAMAFAACGANTGAAQPPAADAAGQTAALDETDYLSWSGKDWNAASDAEKQAATKKVLEKSAEAIGASIPGELFDEKDVNETLAAIDTMFQANPSITLQDVVDAGTEVQS